MERCNSPGQVTTRIPSTVEEAIVSRRSIRAFRSDPVPRALVERILEIATRAPSGSNTQPWKVYVLLGGALEALKQKLVAAYLGGDPGAEEYDYYPLTWREPYLSRRRKSGWDLYGTLGIVRGDKEGMTRQQARNYRFFDAPVGLIFTIDRDLATGSWLDYGTFLQSIMIAARGVGLDTCPLQSMARYHAIIRRSVGATDAEVVICGMALGHADMTAPENNFTTDRMALAEFVRFVSNDEIV